MRSPTDRAWRLLTGLFLCLSACGTPEPPQSDVGPADAGRDAAPILDAAAPPDDGPRDDEPDLPRFVARGALGAGCETDDDCQDGLCLLGPQWPGGYCATRDCSSCATAECYPHDGGETCLRTCDDARVCRPDYFCLATPGPSSVCAHPVGAPVGAPCTTDEECLGGTCLTGLPGGYCTRVGCNPAEGCDGDVPAECAPLPLHGTGCLRACASDDDCRDDFVCRLAGTGQSVCTYPRPTYHGAIPGTQLCATPENGFAKIAIDIPQGSKSTVITTYAPDGGNTGLRHIDTPSGRRLFFDRENGFDIRYHWTAVFRSFKLPASLEHDAPLEPGTYLLSIASNAEEVCTWATTTAQHGSELRLRLHFVGSTDLDAANAPTHPVLTSALATADELLPEISLEVSDYVDIGGYEAIKFSFIHSIQEFEGLLAYGGPPPDADPWVVNVYLVRDILGRYTLGIAGDILVPPGLHHTSISGLVIPYDKFGDDGVLLGHTLAHELGHVLGLWHTSEIYTNEVDHLPDTAECLSSSCEARSNLMYPFVGDDHDVTVSTHQRFQIKTNPLLRVVNACDCHGAALCTDTDTGTCVCPSDLATRDATCVYDCEDDSDCTVGAECTITPSSTQCTCAPGWFGDGTTCANIDDCATAVCPTDTVCVDELQGYHCECPHGTAGNPPNCVAEPRVAPRLTSADGTTCGLDPSGDATCWNSAVTSQRTGPFTRITSAPGFACALDAAGQVDCWGTFTGGEDVAPTGPFTEIECDTGHCCALHTSGDILCWGDRSQGTLAGPFVDLSVQDTSVCGLRDDGSVQCGASGAGALGHVVNDIVLVGTTVCGLRTNRTVACSDGQTSALEPYRFITRDNDGSLCGVDTFGKIQCDIVSMTPQRYYGSDVIEVSFAEHHYCTVSSSGSVFCNGNGGFVPAALK